jgi:hypothetical protein
LEATELAHIVLGIVSKREFFNGHYLFLSRLTLSLLLDFDSQWRRLFGVGQRRSVGWSNQRQGNEKKKQKRKKKSRENNNLT